MTHRAGLLIPSSNTSVEYEYNRFGPPDVSWHAARLTFTTITQEALAAQDAEMLQEARKLATANPHLLLVCQSAIGFVLGPAYEQALTARLQAETGIPALSLAAAMAQALQALHATRIALATPFPSGVDAAAAAYLAQAGFTITRTVSLGLSGNFALAQIPPDQLTALAKQANAPGTDVIVLPGGNLRTLALLPGLEAALGKPVLTTNQAALWATARALGIHFQGPGRLAAA